MGENSESHEKGDSEERMPASRSYNVDDNPNASGDFESKLAKNDGDVNKPFSFPKKRHPKWDNKPSRFPKKRKSKWDYFWNHSIVLPPANFLNIDQKELKGKLKKHLAGQVDRNDPNKMSSDEVKRYKDEIKVGDLTQLLGTNLHIYQPSQYSLYDLGRRFIVKKMNAKEHINRGPNIEVNSLIPKLAPPELVLAVAKESARLEAAQPVDPDQYTSPMKNKSLRSGDFWNSYWKDEIADPLALRSAPEKMESLKVKLNPGTPIYEYLAELNTSNPKLLYVINKNE